jgi:hypothetical protein
MAGEGRPSRDGPQLRIWADGLPHKFLSRQAGIRGKRREYAGKTPSNAQYSGSLAAFDTPPSPGGKRRQEAGFRAFLHGLPPKWREARNPGQEAPSPKLQHPEKRQIPSANPDCRGRAPSCVKKSGKVCGGLPTRRHAGTVDARPWSRAFYILPSYFCLSAGAARRCGMDGHASVLLV